MIEVKNLTKKYGDHVAVDNLSFTVDEGQVYGFLGPNGAGKSTTMNIMTGYLAPTEGDVIINGHNIIEEPEAAKKTVGYLPEIPPLYVDMTVREYLKFVAELKKVPKIEINTVLHDIMDELGVTDVADRLIRHLSKGYRQRVGFAQALIGNPETLILDEPTVGLDPKQIIEIRELIKSLGRKHTVILSSHILSEVSEICDTVLIISKGKLVACDTPENLAKGQSETASVTVTSPDSKTEVLQALLTVAQAEDISISVDDQKLVHAIVTVPGNEDPRREIVQALKSRNCEYYSVDVKKASLEDIFLELTANEKEDQIAEDEEAMDDKTEADSAEASQGNDTLALSGFQSNAEDSAAGEAESAAAAAADAASGAVGNSADAIETAVGKTADAAEAAAHDAASGLTGGEDRK
ncbi:MAG TPA: ABC transporter ATP-binding protein [Lachnospiraceae bacterium]|nr:ABC transporter ATP-binding protein [Lachnospiraceae bacterium]